MGYKDIFIPLVVGLILIFGGEKLIKRQDPAFQRKKRSLRIGGYILLGIAALYTIIILKKDNCITC
ncbi:hypothetical protein SAMN05518672_106134 [Chitinophaga sp. CF118]|nr:hypothetical protein SAMN05518672_106134 [Chitinophaga sp. CF118]